MIQLRPFYTASARFHGLDPEAARALGRLALRGCIESKARAQGGKNSSPPVTPPMAAKFVLACLAGGLRKDSAVRVRGLWSAARVEIDSDISSTTLGDAVVALIAGPAQAQQVGMLRVWRGFNYATITLESGQRTRFGSHEDIEAVARADQAGLIQIRGCVRGVGLAFIGGLIA